LNTAAGIDTGLFYLLNTTLTASFLDVVMSLVSTKGLLVGVGVLAGALSFVLGGKAMKWTLVLGFSSLKNFLQGLGPAMHSRG
jgi:hypothetical protein